ncbi:hypothetical protein ACVNPS_08370 [Candidatus Bipolaricaulota sp. J31]
MRRGVLIAAILVFTGVTGLSLELSGAWSTYISLGHPIAPVNSLTLNLGFAEWELTATSILKGTSFVRQELSLSGSLGAFGISAGVAFRIPEAAAFSRVGPLDFSLEGVELIGGYISFELGLGNLTLKLTLVEGTPPLPEP